MSWAKSTLAGWARPAPADAITANTARANEKNGRRRMVCSRSHGESAKQLIFPEYPFVAPAPPSPRHHLGRACSNGLPRLLDLRPVPPPTQAQVRRHGRGSIIRVFSIITGGLTVTHLSSSSRSRSARAHRRGRRASKFAVPTRERGNKGCAHARSRSDALRRNGLPDAPRRVCSRSARTRVGRGRRYLRRILPHLLHGPIHARNSGRGSNAAPSEASAGSFSQRSSTVA